MSAPPSANFLEIQPLPESDPRHEDFDVDYDGDRAVANRAPRTLAELLACLRARARWPGCPLEGGDLDWTELPNFGGPEPEDTDLVWSWDEDSVLVGESPDDIEIINREVA